MDSRGRGRWRDLVLANAAALGLLAVALLAGWREAALFGLGVLAVLNIIVLVRERVARTKEE